MKSVELPTPRPFLSWMAQKPQYRKHITDLLGSAPVNLVDPFLGSGGFLFNLSRAQMVKSAIINDIHSDLILSYRMIKECPDLIIRELMDPIYTYKPTAFKKIRATDPSGLNSVKKAARHIYLSNCVGGDVKYDIGGRFTGTFDLTYAGRHKRDLNINNIRSVSQVLQQCEIYNKDFPEIVSMAKPGDFLYLDPPNISYHPSIPHMDFYKFTEEQFRKLHESTLIAHEKGVLFALALEPREFHIRLWKDFKFILLKGPDLSSGFFCRENKLRALIIHNFTDVDPVVTKQLYAYSQ